MRRTQNCQWYYEIMDVFAGRDSSSFTPEFPMAFGHQGRDLNTKLMIMVVDKSEFVLTEC